MSPEAPVPASSAASAARNGRGSWVYPALLAATILLASSQSAVAAPSGLHVDKLAHFLLYGLLATLLARTQPRPRWWLGAVGAALFGVLDEGVQALTPGRFVEFADWVADAGGALLAVTLYSRWTWYRVWLEWPVGRRSPEAR